MTVRVVPLDAMEELPTGRLEAAVAALQAAAGDIGPLLGIDRVDVMVHPSERLIPGWDLNGYAINAGLVMIGLSTKAKLLADRDEGERIVVRVRSLHDQLRSVLAHELHHVMRSRGPGYGTSLGDALVSEGLAQCFEEEAGCPTPNYATAVTGELLGLAAMRARKDWELTDYDHAAGSSATAAIRPGPGAAATASVTPSCATTSPRPGRRPRPRSTSRPDVSGLRLKVSWRGSPPS